jgi:hypothetical protein
MAGHVHAVLLILAAVGPVVAAAVRPTANPSTSVLHRVVGTVGGMLVIWLCCGIWTHGCGAGDPLWQWLLPMAGWGVIGLMRLGGRERRRFFAVELILAVLLSLHYVELVHSEELTGNPAWAELTARLDHRQVRVKRTWHTAVSGIYSVQVVPGRIASPLDGL